MPTTIEFFAHRIPFDIKVFFDAPTQRGCEYIRMIHMPAREEELSSYEQQPLNGTTSAKV